MHISSVEDTHFNYNQIKINGILMDLSIPKIMGILNVTEDSFFEDSRLKSDKALIDKTNQYLSEGADILDLGGFSTRPNSKLVDEKIELIRVKSALRTLKNNFPNAIVSVDTFRASVAQMAIDEGASIINDISGFQFDKELLNILSKNNIPYVLMHVEGTFESMHSQSSTGKILAKVGEYFTQKISILKESGVEQVILDPGFGFSKTIEENFELLHQLEEFKVFQKPILVGVSRKSMIYKKLEITPEESLNGTTVLNTLAILKGAGIIRVHDVKACKEIIDLIVK